MRREDVYPGKDSSRDDPALAALDARDEHKDATEEEEDGTNAACGTRGTCGTNADEDQNNR